jgi:GTP-binding protein YchF
MEIGIVGLPFSGKTTLFSTLTGMPVDLSHTGKIETHRGIVKVPDDRLDKLAEIVQPEKKVNATIEYIEVGGLESQDVSGKGFDPQFLQVLKTTDALCLVIQAFVNETVPHPSGSIDPARDIRMVESEFILSDLSILETRLAKLDKQIMQSKTDEDIRERELLKKCQVFLEEEKSLREMDFSEEERLKMRGFQFLSAKPLLIVLNYSESDISQEEQILQPLQHFTKKPKVDLTGLCAKVEQEISQLDEEDKQIFMDDLQITQSALDKLIQKSYDLLGLQSFFTMTDDECRAWTIRRGTNAHKAAGVVHSDMERGFIRAEVVHYNEFLETGSLSKCREKGTLRLEGKDYIVQDGDIVLFRFNV